MHITSFKKSQINQSQLDGLLSNYKKGDFATTVQGSMLF
jgi:hypothetical protein